MTNTPNHETVPTVDVVTLGIGDTLSVRISHPTAPPIYFAISPEHAEPRAAALRGMLAHAYHAGRADAERVAAYERAARELDAMAAARREDTES